MRWRRWAVSTKSNRYWNTFGLRTKEERGKAAAAAQIPAVSRRWPAASIAAAVVAALAVGLLIARFFLTPDVDKPMVRFSVLPPVGVQFGAAGPSPFPAVSFDGRYTAFIASGKLWVRDLELLSAQGASRNRNSGCMANCLNISRSRKGSKTGAGT